MTFSAVFQERTTYRWVAVWWTPSGNVVHDKLPKTITSRSHAEAFALGNPPSW